MNINAEHLRLILGLKLKSLRHQQQASLKEVAGEAGLSISYLSEIEKGKKYPKPEKLVDLARALGVSYDELVSLKVNEELMPLKALFSSDFVQAFPFELYGLEAEDLLPLVTDEPMRAGALMRTFLEVGRQYDVQVEHFLFAALRSYQAMHENYFEDLEEAAIAFLERQGWEETAPAADDLRALLTDEYGYQIDETTLPHHPELSRFRSVYLDGPPPTLLINGELMPTQQAFIFAREIGFEELDVAERARTSSWLKVKSFEQVLNNYRASYFAGAALIHRDRLVEDLKAFFGRPQWDPDAFLALQERYRATPEMFYYRMSEVVPALLGLKELYFLRFHNPAGEGRYRLTKLLNMSRVPVPHGMSLSEHYCRRWPSLQLLRELAGQQARGVATGPMARVQQCHFVSEDAEFLVLATARPLALQEGVNSCVSMGVLLDDAARETVRFWQHDDVPRLQVDLTCERCPLSTAECRDRVAEPEIYAAQQEQQRIEAALAELLETYD